MDEKQLRLYEERLKEERERVLEEYGELSEQLKHTLKEYNNDDSGYSAHLADAGTDMMEREKKYLFASAEGQLLLEIEDALDRLRHGEFGDCEMCGNEISPARLEAIPYAKLCIDCKRESER